MCQAWPRGHKGPGEGGSFCIMMGVMEGGLYNMYGKKSNIYLGCGIGEAKEPQVF